VSRFNHWFLPGRLFVYADHVLAPASASERKETTVASAAKNLFDAWMRPHLLNSIHRTAQLTPALGLDPNNDPGLAGETGLSRD
jgi:hypothetical protein